MCGVSSLTCHRCPGDRRQNYAETRPTGRARVEVVLSPSCLRDTGVNIVHCYFFIVIILEVFTRNHLKTVVSIDLFNENSLEIW